MTIPVVFPEESNELLLAMAVAESIREYPDDNAFVEIRKWFFVKLPVREIMRQKADWLRDLCQEDQKKLLDHTVTSAICKKFPVAFDYQQKFVKTWIQLMEDNNTEVEDLIYETYTTLISAQTVIQEINYKTFVLPDGKELILEESVFMLSNGTTGLQIWPAAFWLAEWILENKEEFKNRCVLELGCGLGFTGLVASMSCEIREYILTDWHVKVLRYLFNNLCLNLRLRKCDNCTMCEECFQKVSNSSSENWDRACNVMKNRRMDEMKDGTIFKCDQIKMKSSLNKKEEVGVNDDGQENKNIEGSTYKMTASDLGDVDVDSNIFQGDSHKTVDVKTAVDCLRTFNKYEESEKVHKHLNKSSRIHFASLDWEEENSETKVSIFPDIIVAADVIFDPKLISPFVETLKSFVSKAIGYIEIYVASSLRSQQTVDQFVEEIGAAGFVLQEISGPSSEVFVYDRSCPLKLFKITAKSSVEEDQLI